MKIERIDRLNLTVGDIDRCVEFYKCSGAQSCTARRAIERRF